MTTTKKIQLRAGDRESRRIMLEAHDAGRHGPIGPDGIVASKGDVLEHWAGVCADCHARWHYEVHHGLTRS